MSRWRRRTGSLAGAKRHRACVRDLLDYKPDYASWREEELGKWFDAGIVEHLIDGLRKAGLEAT